ncbi:YidB family protein [Streptomyces longispororuber]|uniref:YidB family protein n=1 Tax=Streptomyces TaxID=1883 RepID=UPI0024A8EF8C|nr:YidB family protein [Streptomyces sp. CC224B]
MAAIDTPATPLEQFLIATLYDGSNATAAIQELRQAGLGDKVDSWLGSGENQPLTTDELGKVLGDTIGRVAALLGTSTDDVAGRVTQALPATLEALSTHGEIPQQ